MEKNSIYYKQVKMLVGVLPIVAKEKDFALKGGTAINLFVRDFPRLSVDIDLAYLPLEDRNTALANARLALNRIADAINASMKARATLQDNKPDELRIIVSDASATIKVEVSPVARGTLYEPTTMMVHDKVEDEFGYAEIQVVSMPDLYGGKLCAAMDRQHPRDLFDVKLLLENEGISRKILIGFLTYVLSHPRPIHEVMQPNWKDLSAVFRSEFEGMTFVAVTEDELKQTRIKMLDALKHHFDNRDAEFLLSFKRGQPNWTLFDEPSIADLPAVKWKLRNIAKLMQDAEKHDAQVTNLEKSLTNWIS
ncbi:nucleotidyl transferase AbiEii/AbiGii toxin family protein [Brumicola nitratireducens]|uniref:Plasmid-related protein n=1 Tax=Glaciecola nitratireducens (strain JCM 12485 / KCTC 12276 / FR1064) TaxID=1085623 RepID=G4QKY3_GLANF|nr:nucleotidyl transferase AbiEii/AbiGii toxin family protein [Glaciecola nitratireducens]AEP29373.1 plasmid-related protein [Glaciecola nitratireducens FR1064]